MFLPPAEEQTHTQTTSLVPDGTEMSTAPLQSVTLPVPETDIVISVTGTSGSEHSVRSGPNSEHSALNLKEPSPALSAIAGVASESDREPSLPPASGDGGELIEHTTSMLQLASTELELVPIAPAPFAHPETHAKAAEGESDAEGDLS